MKTGLEDGRIALRTDIGKCCEDGWMDSTKMVMRQDGKMTLRWVLRRKVMRMGG
jgi:hypothetical protein